MKKGVRSKMYIQDKTILLNEHTLKGEISEDFIYNVMNSIQLLINTRKKLKANQALARLSRLIRYVIKYSKEQYIPLKIDANLTDSFLYLEQVRNDCYFQYEIRIVNGLKNLNPRISYWKTQENLRKYIEKIGLSGIKKLDVKYENLNDNKLKLKYSILFKDNKKIQSIKNILV